MHKRSKKYFSMLILMSALCLMFADTAKAEESVSNEYKKNYLISRGFPEDVLLHSNSRIVDHVYNHAIQNDTAAFTYQDDESIMELAETSGYTGNSAPLQSSKLKYSVTTVIYTDSSGKVTACDIDMGYDWLVTPETASSDIITLRWDQSLFAFSGYMDGYNHVRNVGNSDLDIYNIVQSASIGESGMIGWYAKLRSPDISPKLQAQPGGRAYVSFLPASPFHINDDIAPDFNIQYNHIKSGSPVKLMVFVLVLSILTVLILYLKQKLSIKQKGT